MVKSSSSQQLIQANTQLLHQMLAAVGVLSASQYQHQQAPHSSVGSHLRHVIEYYQCFLDGLDAGVIDYDGRARDVQLEQDITYGQISLKALVSRVANLSITAQQVQVKESVTAKELSSVIVASTVEREIVFLLSHTIHHMGIIKLLAERFNVVFEDSFGKAPATLLYEQRLSA